VPARRSIRWRAPPRLGQGRSSQAADRWCGWTTGRGWAATACCERAAPRSPPASIAAGSEPQPEASCAFPSAINSDNRLPGTKNEAPAMTDTPLAGHVAALALSVLAVEATCRCLHAQGSASDAGLYGAPAQCGGTRSAGDLDSRRVVALKSERVREARNGGGSQQLLGPVSVGAAGRVEERLSRRR
jgi:hypothetical protein